MLERRELLGEARRLVGQARLFSKLADGARKGCEKCMPEAEKDRLKEALKTHADALKNAGIPHKLVLLRGSGLHLPLLRMFAYHFGFPSYNSELSERLRAKLPRILENVKTEPKDFDLITVGVPQNMAREYLQAAERMKGGPIDITAHLTAEQVANPNNTYSSCFNFFHGLRIPHDREAVNDKKFARHLASVMFFTNAYPLVEFDPSKRRGKSAALREIRRRFDAHLKLLSEEQLEEFNRIMSWHIRRESYVLFNPGIDKTERNANLGKYSPEKSEAMRGWEDDFFNHVRDTLLFPEHTEWLMPMIALIKYAGKKGIIKPVERDWENATPPRKSSAGSKVQARSRKNRA